MGSRSERSSSVSHNVPLNSRFNFLASCTHFLTPSARIHEELPGLSSAARQTSEFRLVARASHVAPPSWSDPTRCRLTRPSLRLNSEKSSPPWRNLLVHLAVPRAVPASSFNELEYFFSSMQFLRGSGWLTLFWQCFSHGVPLYHPIFLIPIGSSETVRPKQGPRRHIEPVYKDRRCTAPNI